MALRGSGHFVIAAEGPQKTLGIEAEVAVEDLSHRIENDEPRCAACLEILHQARIAVHGWVVAEWDRQLVALLRLTQTIECVYLDCLENGLHGREAEALTGQCFNQRFEGRKSVAVTTWAPVLKAKNHLEAVSEIGQLEWPARVPMRVDPLRNSQLRGL